MIVLADKIDCCGCAACYSACPKSCIDMRADEAGFLYPQVIQDKCLDCGVKCLLCKFYLPT